MAVTGAIAGGALLASLAGGLIGGRKKREAEQRRARQLRAQASGIRRDLGAVPELERLDPSMAGLAPDPFATGIQRESLEELSRIGREGLRPEEQARFAEARRLSRAEARGADRRALEDLAGGFGGQALSGRLLANQGAANRANVLGLETEAMSARRALEALVQAGSDAARLRQQSVAEDSARREAADMAARYNSQIARLNFMDRAQLESLLAGIEQGAISADAAADYQRAQNIAGALGTVGDAGTSVGQYYIDENRRREAMRRDDVLRNQARRDYYDRYGRGY